MAGDWIKVENVTPHKPEVMRMAELLGISRRECVGLLIDFWTWLDANARTDSVPNLSRLCLDSSLNCPGFSAALECVGWIKWDDDSASATIPNFEHHNSQSAKTRAYEQKKKQKQRQKVSPTCPPNVPSREEKRREEITTRERVADAPPPPKSAVSVHGTRLDPNWVLPIDWLEWTLAERPDLTSSAVERIALVFRDHWHSKVGADARKADWFKTWCNWIRRERRDYTKQQSPLAERRARTMDILTGKVRDERLISGAVVLPISGDLRESDGCDVAERGPKRITGNVG